MYDHLRDRISGPAGVKMSVAPSALRIDVSWNHPVGWDRVRFRLTVNDGEVICPMDIPPGDYAYCFPTTPGRAYVLTLEAHGSGGRTSCDIRPVKAVFNEAEFELLYKKATNYSLPAFDRIEYFYRCKPLSYWEDIMTRRGKRMQKYTKDNGGQPGNLINGLLNGLFFGGRLYGEFTALDKRGLPPESPFGDYRLLLKCQALMHPDDVNLYFADFYCNTKDHYVTLVICRKGRSSDRFCADRLKLLDMELNPFLYCQRSKQHDSFDYFINRRLFVEILYTESIHLGLRDLQPIKPMGAGTARIGGLPNNKQCTVCNLYPERPEGSQKS